MAGLEGFLRPEAYAAYKNTHDKWEWSFSKRHFSKRDRLVYEARKKGSDDDDPPLLFYSARDVELQVMGK